MARSVIALALVASILVVSTSASQIDIDRLARSSSSSSSFLRRADVKPMHAAVKSMQYLPGGDSMPGAPIVPRWNGSFPYKTHHQQREAWGERLLAAAGNTDAALKGCGGFVKFEGYTWCLKAMPADVSPSANNHKLYGLNTWRPTSDGFVQANKEASTMSAERPEGSTFEAFSYGIRDRDLWSQFISNRHGVPTKLYDCFWDQDSGPMGSKRLTAKALGQNGCGYWRNDGVCYGAEYDAEKVCIASKAHTMHTEDNRTLKFETLASTLKGRKPLSTFLKVDIEGSEWSVLEQLLDSPDDMAKIRSLDMEVHLNKFDDLEVERKDPAGVMERKVRVMERLAQEFATVGSTIGHLHDTLKKTIESSQRKNPEFLELEPQCCYTKGGFSLDQYMISFVNKKMLV